MGIHLDFFIIKDLVILSIPELLSVLLPLSTFLGIILVLSRLYSDSEMVIMRMSGIVNHKILKFLFIPIFSICLISLVMTFWVSPIAKLQYYAKRGDIQFSKNLSLITPGQFYSIGNSTMYISEQNNEGEMSGIFFVTRDRDNLSVTFSDRGYQDSQNLSDNDDILSLENGMRYEGDPKKDNDFSVTNFMKYNINLSAGDNGATLNSYSYKSSTKNINALYSSKKSPDKVELQWRIAFAMAPFILGIVAILMSYIRPRESQFISILPALLLFAFYYQLLVLAKHYAYGIHNQMLIILTMQSVNLFILLVAYFYYLFRKRLAP